MPCEIALGPLAIRFSLWLRYGRKRNAHKPVQRLAPSREWPSLWKPPLLERTAPLPPYRWIFRGRISPAFPGQSHPMRTIVSLLRAFHAVSRSATQCVFQKFPLKPAPVGRCGNADLLFQVAIQQGLSLVPCVLGASFFSFCTFDSSWLISAYFGSYLASWVRRLFIIWL